MRSMDWQSLSSTALEANTCMDLVLYSPPISFSTRFRNQVDGATGVPLESFTCFPKLPAELRVMIWKFTFPGPRLVEVQRHCSNGVYKLLSPTPVPIALHVNAESRTEALKVYTIAFGYRRSPSRIVPARFRRNRQPVDQMHCPQPRIPFNFDSDFLTWAEILYIDNRLERGRCPVSHMTSRDLDRVRKVAHHHEAPYSSSLDPCLSFTGLKVLRRVTVPRNTSNQHIKSCMENYWDREYNRMLRNPSWRIYNPNNIDISAIKRPTKFEVIKLTKLKSESQNTFKRMKEVCQQIRRAEDAVREERRQARQRFLQAQNQEP